MNLDAIEWLFFDMGGVILNDDQPERLRQATTLEVAKKYKPELTMEDVHTAWMNSSGEQGSLRLLAFKTLLKDHPQLAEAETEFNILCTHDYHGLSSIRPEAKDVLAELSKHYKIGITANQSAKTGDILEAAGLLPYFSHQKMSAQIGLEKPDPKFFLHVLEETGAAPKKSVIIDDNWYRGLAPAKNLGMNTGLFKRDIIPYPETAEPDFAINKLEELLDILLVK